MYNKIINRIIQLLAKHCSVSLITVYVILKKIPKDKVRLVLEIQNKA